MLPPLPRSTLFPYTTLFRSQESSFRKTGPNRDYLRRRERPRDVGMVWRESKSWGGLAHRSEEHTSELQSRPHLVCRLLLEKKKKKITDKGTQVQKKIPLCDR